MQPNTSPCFLLDGKSILPLTGHEEEQNIGIPLKYLQANSLLFCPCYFRHCFDRRLTDDDHVAHANNNKRPWSRIEDDTERCSCSPTEQRSNNHRTSRRVLSAKRRRSTDHHHPGVETYLITRLLPSANVSIDSIAGATTSPSSAVNIIIKSSVGTLLPRVSSQRHLSTFKDLARAVPSSDLVQPTKTLLDLYQERKKNIG